MRSELPTGTVTFLFTDVEGSTRLLHELGTEPYAKALAEHRRVVREVCADQGGVEVDTQGDAFFIAFPTASGALEAARLINERLDSGPIRLRMGLHTGTPLVTEEGFVGPDVHRAARIAAAGHGGQVLVSSVASALVDTDLRDLGEHRLKDLARPERIYQLGNREFPPLKSLYKTNLPVPASTFLGRERELRDVVELVTRPDVRLLTLTGPGGAGKTRLALQAAAEAADAFPDGVFWVALAPLRDASVLLSSVAESLGLGEATVVATMLANNRVLLLLDNAEHLLPEIATDVAGLLAPEGSVLLVTSRERLQIQGEQLYPVHPMDDHDGVELFRTRARALDPTFTSNNDAEELCRRLDNLPLALELAAARTVVFSPAQLLERLGQRLDLLKGGRDADPRQQTLRATIEWSYDLLEPREQRLLRSLSVFVGGCTFDAARGVCDGDGDGLQSILDKSLLRKRNTELGSRYWMLETIREYAAERLEDAGEDDDLRGRHARFFLELGKSLGLSVDAFDPGTPQRHDVALADLDNFRAAMDWACERDPQLGLEVAIALEQHFAAHDPLEGRRWYEELLARAGVLDPELRARALRSLGGIAEFGGDFDEAERDYTESFQLYEDMGDEWGIVHLRHRLANCAVHRGDLERAKLMYEQNLARARKIRRGSLEAEALLGLGMVALQAGDFQESYDRYRDATVKCRELRWPWGETNAVLRVGELAFELGRPEEADEQARAALRIARDMRGRLNCARGVTLLAAVARLQGDAERAGRLWGTVVGDQERRGPLERPDVLQRLIPHIVATCDPGFDRGLAAGRNLRLEDVVESVLANPK